MRAIHRRLPSPAMIVACAAFVSSLGGVGYAAGVLPSNSVGTAQLQKKAVTSSKLRANVVSGPQVKNGSLMAADFRAGQLPAGAQGPKGDKGDPGAAGVTGYELVNGADVWVKPGQFGVGYVDCPAGKKVIGGGGGSEGSAPITLLGPYSNHQWAVGARKGSAVNVAAWAYCANVG
jgi:hypothetical protein